MKYKDLLKQLFLLLMAFTISNSLFAQADTTIKKIDSIKANNAITITAEVNYLRHYLWRSILFGSNDVSQPTINIEYKGFYINLACNLNLIPKNLSEEFYEKKVFFDEQDVEIGYANTFKKLDYKVRILAYYYFNQIGSPSTKEISVSLSHPIYKNLTGFTEFVKDIRAYKGGLYNNTGLAYEFTKGKTDFAIKSSMGYGNATFTNAYFGIEKAGLFYWGNQVEVTHNFKTFYCRLSAETNFYTRKDIKEAAEQNTTSNFGITFGKEFNLKLKH
jgi:hypothetical protein